MWGRWTNRITVTPEVSVCLFNCNMRTRLLQRRIATFNAQSTLSTWESEWKQIKLSPKLEQTCMTYFLSRSTKFLKIYSLFCMQLQWINTGAFKFQKWQKITIKSSWKWSKQKWYTDQLIHWNDLLSLIFSMTQLISVPIYRFRMSFEF